jgi:hypothetical protein
MCELFRDMFLALTLGTKLMPHKVKNLSDLKRYDTPFCFEKSSNLLYFLINVPYLHLII